MKILHIISGIDLAGGGPSKSTCDLALYQALRGVNVTIFTQASVNPFLSESPNLNLNILFSKSSTFKLDLKKLVETEKFDILHGHGIWELPVHYMAELGRKNRIPYLITPHGTLHPWALNQKKWKKKIALLFYQRKDLEMAFCLHATSSIEAKYFRDFGIKIPISVISNGLEIGEFPVGTSNKAKEKYILLYLSRVHSQKGLSFLIDAWEKLDLCLRKNWQVEIAGNGEENYVASLKKSIIERGFADEIKIIGPQYGDSKLATYHRADLFVLPSFSENFGIVVAEALACGIPVITTKGTPWEELNSWNAGWWVNIGVAPLKEALTKAMNLSQIERLQMGRKGRQLIENNYSIESVAEKMIILYELILKGGEKPEFVV